MKEKLYKSKTCHFTCGCDVDHEEVIRIGQIIRCPEHGIESVLTTATMVCNCGTVIELERKNIRQESCRPCAVQRNQERSGKQARDAAYKKAYRDRHKPVEIDYDEPISYDPSPGRKRRRKGQTRCVTCNCFLSAANKHEDCDSHHVNKYMDQGREEWERRPWMNYVIMDYGQVLGTTVREG